MKTIKFINKSGNIESFSEEMPLSSEKKGIYLILVHNAIFRLWILWKNGKANKLFPRNYICN